MKKSIIFVMMGAALLFTSCKSSQSAYKQAYEKAKAQESAVTTAPVQTPAQTAPVEEKKSAAPAVADAPVRSEQVVSVTGDLKTYSVVCGSFGVKANADGLCEQLKSAGYKAGIVKNTDKNMYRVFIGTYNTKSEALSAMNTFKAAYPTREDFQGSWILMKK